jgi:hypothetical protein
MDLRQKSFEIQHQIRHNANVMGSEMGDLSKWEKTIKKRDKKMRKVSVRGTAGGKVRFSLQSLFLGHITQKFLISSRRYAAEARFH